MFFVLSIADPADPSPLGLEPRTREAAQRAINWQAKGGFERSGYVVATYDAARRLFVGDDGATYQPKTRGVYTVEAWAEFCARYPLGQLRPFTVVGFHDGDYGVDSFVEHVEAEDAAAAWSAAVEQAAAECDNQGRQRRQAFRDGATEIATFPGHHPDGEASRRPDAPETSESLRIEGHRVMRGARYMFALVRGAAGDGAPTWAELEACAAELAAKVNGQ